MIMEADSIEEHVMELNGQESEGEKKITREVR